MTAFDKLEASIRTLHPAMAAKLAAELAATSRQPRRDVDAPTVHDLAASSASSADNANRWGATYPSRARDAARDATGYAVTVAREVACERANDRWYAASRGCSLPSEERHLAYATILHEEFDAVDRRAIDLAKVTP